jgi:uncharacterized DUF497 family protein
LEVERSRAWVIPESPSAETALQLRSGQLAKEAGFRLVVSSNLCEGRLELVLLATPNRQVAEVDQNHDEEIIRIISARKATACERKIYAPGIEQPS